MTEEKSITDSRIDYEPKGCIKSSPAISIGLYIFAGVLIIAGIIVYFAVMPELIVFAVFVFLAVLSVMMGIASAKHAWYWNDEKFTVLQFLAKPATYSFGDIDTVFTVTEGPAVTLMLRMKNGKQFGISMQANGTQAFLEHLRAIQEKYNDKA